MCERERERERQRPCGRMSEALRERFVTFDVGLYRDDVRCATIYSNTLRQGPRLHGGDEERGRERDKCNERDRNPGWKSDAPSARDRDKERDSDREREYTQTWRPSKLFNHVNELNKQILNNSDTRELFRDRDGTDRQKGRGKDIGDDMGRGCRARNDRNNERDRNKDCQRSRDRPRDSDRDCDSDRDSQYTLTQRSRK